MKILMVKTSSLGDIIHAFPVVAYLKREFPDAQIDWVVEKSFSDVVKAHPLVDRVIEMDTKGWRKRLGSLSIWKDLLRFRREMQASEYDAVIDLQGNTKSAIPTWLAKSAHKVGFGRKTLHEWPNLLATHHRFNPPLFLNVRDENLFIVQHYFQRYSSSDGEKVILKLNEEQQGLLDGLWDKVKGRPGEKILVCPGSAWKNKQLSEDALQTFLLKICQHHETTFFLAWGTPAEKEVAQKLQDVLKEKALVVDKMPLPALQNLMSRMDLVIAMDSLPLHLAGTSGTPTFSIFGASSAQKYRPLGDIHHSIQGPCPYGRVFERRCPVLRTCPTGLCIQGLPGEALFQDYFQWKYGRNISS
jgi:heptosyltransferase I